MKTSILPLALVTLLVSAVVAAVTVEDNPLPR